MIRIGNTWHYEPWNGDISAMQLRKALWKAGIDIKLTPPISVGLRTMIWVQHFGSGLVPESGICSLTIR